MRDSEKELIPPWQVTPEEFWQHPTDFKIDLPLEVIDKEFKEGTLHRTIVKLALSKQEEVPESIRKKYAL
jgi:hypothetical protein